MAHKLSAESIYAACIQQWPGPDDALAATAIALTVSGGDVASGNVVDIPGLDLRVDDTHSGPAGLFMIDKPTAECVGQAYGGDGGQHLPSTATRTAHAVFTGGAHCHGMTVGAGWDLWKPHPWLVWIPAARVGQAAYNKDPDGAKQRLADQEAAFGNIPKQVAQKVADPLGIGSITDFLRTLGNPQVLLQIALGIGGGLLIIMGAFLVLEHTGAGPALSKATKTMSKGST